MEFYDEKIKALAIEIYELDAEVYKKLGSSLGRVVATPVVKCMAPAVVRKTRYVGVLSRCLWQFRVALYLREPTHILEMHRTLWSSHYQTKTVSTCHRSLVT